MTPIFPKYLFWHDNNIKFLIKTPFQLFANFTVFVNYNSKRLALSEYELTLWVFASANLMNLYIAPAYIKHACSTFKSRVGDLHGAFLFTRDEAAKLFMFTFATRNFSPIWRDQYALKLGGDDSGEGLSVGLRDLKKIHMFRRTYLRYVGIKIGCTASAVVWGRFEDVVRVHVSQLVCYSYFLNQHVSFTPHKNA